MISRKLAHKVNNMLQMVMSHIDVAELKMDKGKIEEARVALTAAKGQLHKISMMLGTNVKDFKDRPKPNV